MTNILMVVGKPDLSELVSQTKGGAVVKSLVSGAKFPVFRNDRISSLAEIRIFTEEGDCPLQEVLQAAYKLLEGKPTAFEPKKASGEELFGLLGQVLPSYDRERVHTSDVKKLFAWYNILLAAGKIDLEAKAPQEVAAAKEEKVEE